MPIFLLKKEWKENFSSMVAKNPAMNIKKINNRLFVEKFSPRRTTPRMTVIATLILNSGENTVRSRTLSARKYMALPIASNIAARIMKVQLVGHPPPYK